MGIRGELFSTRCTCEGRTYFFNVKQNRNGDVFLSIVESKPSEGESFDRRSIVVFGESMEAFLRSFDAALKYMDKTGNKVAPDPTASIHREEGEDSHRPEGPRRRSEFQRYERGPSTTRDAGKVEPRPEGRTPRSYSLKPREDQPRRQTRDAAGQERPVKRIVVRRAKGKDSED